MKRLIASCLLLLSCAHQGPRIVEFATVADDTSAWVCYPKDGDTQNLKCINLQMFVGIILKLQGEEANYDFSPDPQEKHEL